MTIDYDGELDPKPSSEPFMEPRTIPKKWDVSAFNTQETSSRDKSAEGSSEPTAPDITAADEAMAKVRLSIHSPSPELFQAIGMFLI